MYILAEEKYIICVMKFEKIEICKLSFVKTAIVFAVWYKKSTPSWKSARGPYNAENKDDSGYGIYVET